MDFVNHNTAEKILENKEEIKKIKKLIEREMLYSKKKIFLKIGDKIELLFGDKKTENLNEDEKQLLFPSNFPGFKIKYSHIFYFQKICHIKVNDVAIYDSYKEQKKMEDCIKRNAAKFLDEYFHKGRQKYFKKDFKVHLSQIPELEKKMFQSSMKKLLANLIATE